MTNLEAHFSALNYDTDEDARVFVRSSSSEPWEEFTEFRSLSVKREIHRPMLLELDGHPIYHLDWRAFLGHDFIGEGRAWEWRGP